MKRRNFLKSCGCIGVGVFAIPFSLFSLGLVVEGDLIENLGDFDKSLTQDEIIELSHTSQTSDSDWVHIVCVFDKDGQCALVYKNGELRSQGSEDFEIADGYSVSFWKKAL